jgi:hypothetical protein
MKRIAFVSMLIAVTLSVGFSAIAQQKLNRTNQLWDSGIGHRDHREHRGKRACAFPLRALCVLCGYCLNLVWSDLVEDIEIRGYRTAPIEEIKKRIKTQPGDEYKQEQAQQDFQSILDMKAFDALKSKLVVEPGPRGGVIVIFDLKETSK